MTTINPLSRSVHEVLETNLTWQKSFDHTNVKKAYTYVKHVTGLKTSTVNDYQVINGRWYEYDTVTIRGQKGFIRLALKPLFQVI